MDIYPNLKYTSLGIYIKMKMGLITLLRSIPAFLLKLQMWNLRTDYYKVSIGDYFCALCGDFSALRKVKFIHTTELANRLACDILSNSVDKQNKENKIEDIISDIRGINSTLYNINTLLLVFEAKYILPDGMQAFAKQKGLLEHDCLSVKKVKSKVNNLLVKKKILLSEFNELKKAKNNPNVSITKSKLAEQIAAINHAGGRISLDSSVSEYFAELTYLMKLAKEEQNNGR